MAKIKFNAPERSLGTAAIMFVLTLTATAILAGHRSPNGSAMAAPEASNPAIYLPITANQYYSGPRISRKVNAPYFNGEIKYEQTAVFWFGRVTPTENYVDGRVGYNDNQIEVNLSIVDRRLWYNPNPTAQDITKWDAADLYLSTTGNDSTAPEPTSYHFEAELNWWEARDKFQTAFQGNGTDWVAATIPFTTTTGWRGDAPNNNTDDRGWVVSFHIPFASLGYSSPPPQDTNWHMALIVYDRDDASGTPIPEQRWPEAADPRHPTTWGLLHFGLLNYVRPNTLTAGALTIQDKLNGAKVSDAGVGGYTTCGAGVDFWKQWGDSNESTYNPSRSDFNIQNQADVADWPCFSKEYITFPLDAIPPGRDIISATLTLHQFGNAQGSQPSLIQVLTIGENWNEMNLTWNNAPMAVENISRAWVSPLSSFPGWPGVSREWDVSLAVAQAYLNKLPLRLALYEADGAYSSGKYFVASDTGDWNAAARPTLRVIFSEISR
jgi:hypothetical protein